MKLKRIYTGDSWTLLDGDTAVLTVKEAMDTETNRAVITLEGSLRSDTEPIFQSELNALSSVGVGILLDLGGLTGISNACQRSLVNLQQKMDQTGKSSLTLRNVPEDIYKQFKQTHLLELLDIE